jgi:RIO kinase 1
VDELVGQVKGGKEATVYLMRRGDELLAAKVYADLESRSFRNDARYWSGVHIADKRVERAMRRRSRTGRAAQHGIWVMREYINLWRLHEAGVRVPRPAIGPSAKECAEAGSVVLMEFIGAGDQPAPRLSDVKLDEAEARSALEQSVEILLALARMGLVHGDFSTYNLLWHEEQVVLIDVPQVIDVRSAQREAEELLVRDVESLQTSFRRHRVELPAEELLSQALTLLRARTTGGQDD